VTHRLVGKPRSGAAGAGGPLGYESFECRSGGSIWFYHRAIWPGLRLSLLVVVPRCSGLCRLVL
jgi:hypothetical protein